VDKNTTVVFPSPIMTTIAELSAFIASEKAAAAARPALAEGSPVIAAAPARPTSDAA
jgi:hypothetical protein